MTGSSVTIRIGDEDFDKPFDPGCLVCTSPHHLQVDTLLASGWTLKAIADRMRVMKPKGPAQRSIGAHIPHLAQPHLEQRSRLAPDGLDLEDVPSMRTVADTALQHVLTGMALGSITPQIRDVIAAYRFQHQLDAADSDVADRRLLQQALIEIYEIAFRHMPVQARDGFARDVYASETLAALIPRRPLAVAGGSS